MELACTATTSTTSVSRGISDVGARAQATGTTLGADNGIGVAAALALLDQPAGAALPPLECLFTVDEETGLTGAFQLDASMLTGARPLPAALRLSAPRRARWPCLYAPGARRWHRQTQAARCIDGAAYGVVGGMHRVPARARRPRTCSNARWSRAACPQLRLEAQHRSCARAGRTMLNLDTGAPVGCLPGSLLVSRSRAAHGAERWARAGQRTGRRSSSAARAAGTRSWRCRWPSRPCRRAPRRSRSRCQVAAAAKPVHAFDVPTGSHRALRQHEERC